MSESKLIVYIDRSEVLEGKLEELKAAYLELAAFVEVHEPRIIAYNVYFNADGRRATVVHVHPDAASLEFHFKVAGAAFTPFADLLRLISIDIYGDPGSSVLQQVRAKAELLGRGTVNVHQHHAGFARSALH